MAELKAQKTEVEEAPKLSEREVTQYLKSHPDFLARHPELLETLELRHKSGSAVSLIERQVDILRAKNLKLEDRLVRLVDAARDNERRTDNVLKLARTLIRAPSLAGVAAGLSRCMRDDFDIEETYIGIAARELRRHDIAGLHPVEAEGKIAKAFENFFTTRLIECGPLTEARAKLLFPNASPLPQSAAVIPLSGQEPGHAGAGVEGPGPLSAAPGEIVSRADGRAARCGGARAALSHPR